MNDLLNNVNNIVTNNEDERNLENINNNLEYGDNIEKGLAFRV